MELHGLHSDGLGDCMRVIVAGSRTFADYEMMKVTLDHILRDVESIEIVSGGARGADALGEHYAREKGFKLTRFPAEWERYGKRAGYIRNRKMAEYVCPDGRCVVFWDGKSRGSKMMILLAHEYGIPCRVVMFGGEEDGQARHNEKGVNHT